MSVAKPGNIELGAVDKLLYNYWQPPFGANFIIICFYLVGVVGYICVIKFTFYKYRELEIRGHIPDAAVVMDIFALRDMDTIFLPKFIQVHFVPFLKLFHSWKEHVDTHLLKFFL